MVVSNDILLYLKRVNETNQCVSDYRAAGAMKEERERLGSLDRGE